MASDGAGLFVKCRLPYGKTEWMLDVDERLSIFDCDGIILIGPGLLIVLPRTRRR